MAVNNASDRGGRTRSGLTPARIALVYALAGSFWILLTDYLAAQLFVSKAAITRAEIIKGCFFIITTSLMLYALVRRSVAALRRSEREQRESKARLQSLIENLPFDFWATDASGRYIMENAYTIRRWGDLIGKRPEEVGAPPDVLALWLDNNRRALSGELVRGEAKYTFDDDVRTIYNILAPVRDNGEIRGTVGVNIDITEFRRAEEALRESEEWFRMRYEAISVGLVVYDLSGAITYANRAAGDILDKPVDQLLGKTPFGPEWRAVREDMSSFPPEDYPAMMTIRTGEPVSDVVLGISRGADSERRWLLVNSRPVLDRDTNGLREVIVTFVDITHRKRAESGLQENEALLRLFVEHTPAAVAMFDRDIRYLWYTKRWLSDYRLGDRDITGLSHYEVFPEVPERWKEIHQRVLAGEVERCEADPFPRLDGTMDWVRWEVRPWWNSKCEIGGIIMFTEVITDEVLAKEALQESESKFRSLVDNIPDVVWTTDREGNTSFISPNVEELLGYTPEEIYESGDALWFGSIHPEDVDRVRQALGALFGKGEQYDVEYRMRTRDSRWIWVHDRSISAYRKGGKWFADGVFSDITERKHAEDVLRDSEQRLTDIISFLPDATFAIDLDGKVIAWNRATEVLTGIKAEDMLGKGNYEYSVPIYGARRPMLIDLVLKPNETSEWQYLSVERVHGTLVSEAYTAGLRPGGAYIWSNATPLYDRGGNVVGAIESVRDITDRKKAEDDLRERTELLQTVMDNIPQSIFWKDTNLVYLGGNNSFVEVADLKSPEEVMGKTDYDMPWRGDADHLRQYDRKVMDTGIPEVHYVEHARLVDGRDSWLDTSRIPLHDDQEKVVGMLGIYDDITERKRAEEELLHRREREWQIEAEADEAKRQFYKGTIFSVTDGKLNLVSYDELDNLLVPDAEEIPFASGDELPALRDTIEEYCQSAGMNEDRAYALTIAFGEAAANAIKHADGGAAYIGVRDGSVQVCIKDKGPGMDTLVLPSATLMKGFSTKPSMGLGYSVILASVDTVYLATEKQGTWVLMEKAVKEAPQEISLETLPDTW